MDCVGSERVTVNPEAEATLQRQRGLVLTAAAAFTDTASLGWLNIGDTDSPPCGIRGADCPGSWADQKTVDCSTATPRSRSVLQVLHSRAPSSDASGCNTASFEFISLVRNEEAGGSNPLTSTNVCLFGVRPGHIGDRSFRTHRLHFWPKRVVESLQGFFLQVDVAKIVIHKTNQPNTFFDFFETDSLTSENRAEIDFFAVQTDPPAA